MITFKRTSLEDFVKSYNPTPPLHDDINAFEGHIQAFFSRALGDSGEEYQKNEINGFLKNVFDYDCNTKGKIDSAIYVDGIAQVLIEVKALGKSGFPKSPDNPISTALSESVLYFLREFHVGNNSIKHIILCTPYEFFIFDAKSFLIFERDKHIKELHNNCDAKKGTDTTTKKFYSDLENHLKGDFEGTLPFTYFNLQEALKSEKDLALIYQLLSPQVLLKQQKTIDANTLNKKFYDELLYILGLKEEKDSKSKITRIVPSGVSGTMSAAIKKRYESLSEEEIFALITTWNNRVLFLRLLESLLVSFNHISEKDRFLIGEVIGSFEILDDLFFRVLAKKQNERDSDLKPVIFKQIPYLNSSLFDKTPLEKDGKLIASIASNEVKIFQNSVLKSDKDYKSQTTLPLLEYYLAFLQAYDFTTTPKDIQDNIKTNHDTLINSAVLGLVFEKLNGYKEGSFYTPSFITSYMCEDAINRAIIMRFNAEYGWKCENLKGLEDTFKSYIGDQDKLEKFRKTFLSIRICDPAVGSGHFLVSALNYLIYMAYRLRIFGIGAEIALQNDELLIYHECEIFQYTKPKLSDSHAQKIQQSLFHLKKSIIENCLFGVDINPNSCEITKLRLWIELLKHSYYKIEDNQITNELQTLPNIDINIKCGNSLLSNHPINSPFTTSPTLEFTKELADQIQKYKSAVQRYKDSQSSKSEIIKELEEIKTTLIGHLSENSQTSQSLRKNLESFFNDYGDEVFDIKTDFGRDMLYIIRDKKFSKQLRTEPTPMDKKGEKLLAQIKKDYEILESMKHNNAFEWRFAFPEVLDDKGDFMGFDCVIGNPPYIRQEAIIDQKSNLQKNYQVHGGKADIYVYFYERGHQILSNGGILSYITSNKWVVDDYGKHLRTFLLKNTQILSYIDFNGVKVFDSASVDTSIMTFTKTIPQEDYAIDYLACQEKQIPKSPDFTPIFQSKLSADGFIFADQDILELLTKIRDRGTPLKHWDIVIKYGIKTGCNNAFVIRTAKREEILANCADKHEREKTALLIKKMLKGEDIGRYNYKWGDWWLICIFPSMKINLDYYPSLKNHLREQISKDGDKWFRLAGSFNLDKMADTRILWQRVTQKPSFILDTEGFLPLDSMAYLVGKNLKENLYLLGVLNSKLIHFVLDKVGHKYSDKGYLLSNQYAERFSIPKIDSTNQDIADNIIALVEEILEKKKQDSATDATKLESQINALVYKLYNLTDEEIELIEKG